MNLSALPNDFIFGAATSAYQIEGAVDKDGRGPSIWDDFCRQKARIQSGHSGATACDHYHRYREDIDIMAQLGLQAYRFSIAWPRIFPEGRGKINQCGLDFYKRLVDGLLEKNIRPYATLFHWDMPSALYRSHRGFVSRDTCSFFADYVETVVGQLGDRVKDWITLNEPFEHACLGHLVGSHAPGKHSLKQYLQVMHHQLLAHGMAVQRIRQVSPAASVGITLSITPILPNSDTEKDAWAAQFGNQLLNHITLGPLYKQAYPEEMQRRLRWFWPKTEDNDLAVISQPTDFVGINHYNCERASHRWYIPFLNLWISGANNTCGEHEKNGKQYTAMGWQVEPEGMAQALRMLREDYGNPTVLITENGAAFEDSLREGSVDDKKRIAYFEQYLNEVLQARHIGSKIQGYFAWSLLDNFEWATGYTKRFGLVHVDYNSQQRTIKNSGHWYAKLIQQHRQQNPQQHPKKAQQEHNIR